MRTTEEIQRKACYHSVNGVSTGMTMHDNYRHSVSRSDITRNTRDDRGFLDPSPYLALVDKIVGPTGTWTNSSYGYVSEARGSLKDELYSRGPGLPSGDAGLRSRAEVGALLKLKDQSVDLSIMFAERKRTADLVARSFSTVIKAYKALRKGDLGGVARALNVRRPRELPRDMAGKWLAFQYGWKPLLSDVHGACEALDRAERNRGYRVTVRSRHKQEWEEEYFLDTGPSFCPFVLDRRLHRSYSVALSYAPNNWEQIEFSSLGLSNPGLTAWELVPFSFVVDWAIPVGDWISSLDAARGYEFLGGTLTERRYHISKFRSASQFGGKNRSHLTGGIDFQKRVERWVYPSSPIPTLPRAKNPWSYTHAANAASLLAKVTEGAKAPWRYR